MSLESALAAFGSKEHGVTVASGVTEKSNRYKAVTPVTPGNPLGVTEKFNRIN